MNSEQKFFFILTLAWGIPLVIGIYYHLKTLSDSYAVIDRNITERKFSREIILSQIKECYDSGSLTEEQADDLRNKLSN